jgi:hypothetical protein
MTKENLEVEQEQTGVFSILALMMPPVAPT